MSSRTAWAFGLATTTVGTAATGATTDPSTAATLEVWYPAPALGEPEAGATAPAELLAQGGIGLQLAQGAEQGIGVLGRDRQRRVGGGGEALRLAGSSLYLDEAPPEVAAAFPELARPRG